MFENKEIKVILSEESNEVYEELNRLVGEEKKKCIESSFHQTLLRSINRVKGLLKEKIEIINFIMDIFDHKKYDKVFGYKKG